MLPALKISNFNIKPIPTVTPKIFEYISYLDLKPVALHKISVASFFKGVTLFCIILTTRKYIL